jgi:hypothetical protein
MLLKIKKFEKIQGNFIKFDCNKKIQGLFVEIEFICRLKKSIKKNKQSFIYT